MRMGKPASCSTEQGFACRRTLQITSKGKAMSQETYELKAEARERVGKGSARELRRNGLIPAVIYGDKQAPIAIAINTNEVTKRIHAGGFMTTVATIEVDGKKHKVLPKDYQLDPVRDFTLHVDFLRVSGNTQVTVEIPVHFINEAKSPGLKVGGVLNIVRHEVEVHCPADAIPEFFNIDLSGKKIGDSIHISEVTLPKSVTPVIDRDFTIATIVAPAGGVDESAAEAEGEAEA
ncbi:50S ribosomal protein L25 [Rhizobium etli CFN 42]|nr:50S ribosomal protein L25 [Rhizobium etli CFN 42]